MFYLQLILTEYNTYFNSAFAKLRKTIISFVMSVRLSFRMKHLDSHEKDFDYVLYLGFFFRNSVEKIQVTLKSDNKNGNFTFPHLRQ